MPLTPDEMIALVDRHATLERTGDIDGILADLVDDPVYVLHNGATLRGRENVREYYRRAFELAFPHFRGGGRVSRCLGDDAVIVEDEIVAEIDGETITFRTAAVFPVEGDKLVGERVYTSTVGAAVLDRTFGDVSDLTSDRAAAR